MKIKEQPLVEEEPTSQIAHFAEFGVGAGKNQLKANKEGFFVGSDKFSDAPFKVNYDGNIVANKGSFGGTLDASSIVSGTIPVARTDAKCTNAAADQTSANAQPSTWLSTQVEKSKLGSTVITGGYLKTDLLNTANAYITNTAMIANAVVTNGKIANLAVDNGKIADATILNAKIHDLNANKITTGTMTAVTSVGAGNVKIDGGNKRIIVNDGSHDRILMGYLAGKF